MGTHTLIAAQTVMSSKTRADFPVGKMVQYSESGQEGEIVSEREAEDMEYESDTDVFVEMNGQVVRSDVSKLDAL